MLVINSIRLFCSAKLVIIISCISSFIINIPKKQMQSNLFTQKSYDVVNWSPSKFYALYRVQF